MAPTSKYMDGVTIQMEAAFIECCHVVLCTLHFWYRIEILSLLPNEAEDSSGAVNLHGHGKNWSKLTNIYCSVAPAHDLIPLVTSQPRTQGLSSAGKREVLRMGLGTSEKFWQKTTGDTTWSQPRSQGLSSQGKQRRETLGTRLHMELRRVRSSVWNFSGPISPPSSC